ncbi:MAG: DUF1667 domain-containing protein [Ruminococcaceae bacterium]|nr:DUF1667 domain-containing protein [Oscillospiraceae bacterium]
MTRKITCIICPRGCEMTVDYEGKKVNSVKGNACPRGSVYAENEILSPVRTLTSTVLCEDGSVIAVKTDKPIPKELIFECMKEINKVRVQKSVSAPDIVIENILGTGANVIITGGEI